MQPDLVLTLARCPGRCLWRRKLLECVDATPAVWLHPDHPHPQSDALQPKPALLSSAAAAGTHDALRAAFSSSLCWACSHGGDVVCLNALTGALVWQAGVQGRAAPGMLLHPSHKVRLRPLWRFICAGTTQAWCATE